MRRGISIFFILVSSLISQENITDALEFYPLHTGSYWEYRETSPSQEPSRYDTTYYSIEVKGDTIFNDSQSYKILEKHIIYPYNATFHFFERIDSSTANVYRFDQYDDFPETEYLIDSLMAQEGDSSNAVRSGYNTPEILTTCEMIESDSVLGLFTTVKSFWDQSSIPGINYKLARNMGHVESFACEGPCWNLDLIYCRIKDSEYGSALTNIDKSHLQLIKNFEIYPVYPNPFNSEAVVSFRIQKRSNVSIEVFNILGEQINVLHRGMVEPGFHKVKIRSGFLPSGIYCLKVSVNNFVGVKKFIILK